MQCGIWMRMSSQKKTAISFVEGVKGETRHFTRHKVA
jgi:hypothetical protein